MLLHPVTHRCPRQLPSTLPMLLHPVTHRCPRSITGEFTNAPAPCHPPMNPVNYWRLYQCSCTQSPTDAPGQLLATLPKLLHPVTHRCPRSITGDFTNAPATSPTIAPGQLLLLLLKKYCQCKAGEGDWHPITPKTPAPHNQLIERKKRREISWRQKRREQLGQQRGIGPALETRQSHTIEYGVNQIVPEWYW